VGEILGVLLDPLRYTFMVRGLIAAVVAGGLCALVGTYAVLRGMAFFGDALAHSILPGLAIGYLLSGGSRAHLFWWGLGTALLAALVIGPLAGEGGSKRTPPSGSCSPAPWPWGWS
jgi:ABC-type Mn2+/Zn2+ transport systems, permease components